jgi:hypothetical protein
VDADFEERARDRRSLQNFRQDADYSAEVVFTPNAAAEELAAAEQFIQAVREILARPQP